jgi:hypothetical protein
MEDPITMTLSQRSVAMKGFCGKVPIRSHEEIVPFVMLHHMVGYTRVGKRINFKPTLTICTEIPLEDITFKEN